MKVEKVIQVTNQSGIPFNVVVHEDEGEEKKLVAVYDARYDFTEYGQFVTRYYAESLEKHEGELWLYGDVKDWRLSGDNTKKIYAEIKEVLKKGDKTK